MENVMEGNDNSKLEVVLKSIGDLTGSVAQLVTMEKEDRERFEKIEKNQERIDNIVATELKITDDDQKTIQDDSHTLVHMLCNKSGLLYSEWSCRIYPILNGAVRNACKCTRRSAIKREDTKKALAIIKPTEDNVEKFYNGHRFQAILLESQLNDGKRMNLSKEDRETLVTITELHRDRIGDFDNLTKEQVIKEIIELRKIENKKNK